MLNSINLFAVAPQCTTTTTRIYCGKDDKRDCYYEKKADGTETLVPGGADSIITTIVIKPANIPVNIGGYSFSQVEIAELPKKSVFILSDPNTNHYEHIGDRIGIGLIDVHFYDTPYDDITYYVYSDTSLIIDSYFE